MRVAAVLALLAPLTAGATSVPPQPLPDLVRDSDHVLIATVTKVDMVDGKGAVLSDRNGKTGPGLENEIRFHLEVKEVLFSTSKQLPKQPIVRLWKAWHYTLGKIQDAVTGHTSIFLLKGEQFDPVYPSHFERPLKEREQIEAELRSLGRRNDGP